MVKGQPRVIELRQFDCTKLTKVDVVEQFFKVQFFCHFAFPGGAKDTDLMKMERDGAHMPHTHAHRRLASAEHHGRMHRPTGPHL